LWDHSGVTLATVIEPEQSQTTVTTDWIKQCIDDYKKDDVFQRQFLRAVFFITNRDDFSINLEVEALLRDFGMRWGRIMKASSRTRPFPGPYVLSHGITLKPFRLHSDGNSAFFSATR